MKMEFRTTNPSARRRETTPLRIDIEPRWCGLRRMDCFITSTGSYLPGTPAANCQELLGPTNIVLLIVTNITLFGDLRTTIHALNSFGSDSLLLWCMKHIYAGDQQTQIDLDFFMQEVNNCGHSNSSASASSCRTCDMCDNSLALNGLAKTAMASSTAWKSPQTQCAFRRVSRWNRSFWLLRFLRPFANLRQRCKHAG